MQNLSGRITQLQDTNMCKANPHLVMHFELPVLVLSYKLTLTHPHPPAKLFVRNGCHFLKMLETRAILSVDLSGLFFC